jgi:hypothetical protein
MTSEQIVFVGLLASAITLGLKLLANWFDYRPGRGLLTVALYLVSLGLAGLWTGIFLPPFPPFSDPLTFAAAVLAFVADLLALAAPVLGLATLIYNLLYEKVVVPLSIRVMAFR